MSTNYIGDKTATQSPSAAPEPNNTPTIVLPADADAFNAAAFSQQFKMTADHLAWLMAAQTKTIVNDQFTGSAICTGNWNVTGSVLATNDTASEFHSGIAQGSANGTGIGLRTNTMYIGTKDFWISAKLRYTGVTSATNLYLGINNQLEFAILGGTSTTNWRAYISGSDTAINGTAATIGTSYKIFTIKKIGSTVTLAVDGVTFHTVSSFTTNLTAAQLWIINSGTAGSGTFYLDHYMMVVA